MSFTPNPAEDSLVHLTGESISNRDQFPSVHQHPSKPHLSLPPFHTNTETGKPTYNGYFKKISSPHITGKVPQSTFESHLKSCWSQFIQTHWTQLGLSVTKCFLEINQRGITIIVHDLMSIFNMPFLWIFYTSLVLFEAGSEKNINS